MNKKLLVGLLLVCFLLVGALEAAQRPRKPPNPRPTPPPEHAKLLFGDEFDSMQSLAKGGKWQTSWPLGSGAYSNASEGEQQVYVDVQNGEKHAYPFSVEDGILAIRATPTRGLPQQKPIKGQRPALPMIYSSGVISTAKTFTPTYGYLECKAKIPKGKGFWPLVQLFGSDGHGGFKAKPEIDLLQCSSRINHETYVSVLSEHHPAEQGKFVDAGADLSADFHTYGMDWTPEKINFWLDGKLRLSTTTPPDAKRPCFIAIDLAVGDGDPKGWIGLPDGSTQTFYVDYIRYYSSKP